jgi:S1-C subfamily serine protease
MEPLSVNDLLNHLAKAGDPRGWTAGIAVDRLLSRMCDAGFLTLAGTNGKGPLHHACYYTGFGITQKMGLNPLWQSGFLGADFLATKAPDFIAAVPGHSPEGDSRIGTGIVLDAHHILTCKHVVEDMTLEACIEFVAESSFAATEIAEVESHPEVDVALVTLVRDLPGAESPIFREPRWSDQVSVFGFPPIPLSRRLYFILQAGEIVNPHIEIGSGEARMLYSAVARPGNSGGPIIGRDGMFLGMVTQELGRQTADPRGAGAPFFAGLPCSTLFRAMSELGHDALIVVEDWQ